MDRASARSKPSASRTAAECCPQVLSAPLDDAEAAQLARAFSALADPVRIRLLGLLASSPSGEICVCDLVAPTGRSQPTVSHHLKVLVDTGLITGEKRGRWVWYSVRTERLEALRKALAP